MSEHRLRQRVQFISSIEIDTDDGQQFYEDLANISMNGFFINNIAPFKEYREYNFSLSLTCGENKVEIIGKCTPARVASYESEEKVPKQHHGVGFKITELEPESSEELYRLVTLNALD